MDMVAQREEWSQQAGSPRENPPHIYPIPTSKHAFMRTLNFDSFCQNRRDVIKINMADGRRVNARHPRSSSDQARGQSFVGFRLGKGALGGAVQTAGAKAT